MRPVLFLDIDGVLNSRDWWEKRKPEIQKRRPHWDETSAWKREAEDGFDPEAIHRLNGIVARTSCLVVLSSSWRKMHPLHEITRMMRHVGFEHRLFACTPNIHTEDGPVCRGEEIAWWVDQIGAPVTFAIVDDDSDMEPWQNRFVKTDGKTGLTAEVADKLCALLQEKL